MEEDKDVTMDTSEKDTAVKSLLKGGKEGKKGATKLMETYAKQLERAQNAREKATPDIAARSKNWDGYAHFKVRTKRGIKVKAKEEWANKVVAHMTDKKYIVDGNT